MRTDIFNISVRILYSKYINYKNSYSKYKYMIKILKIYPVFEINLVNY